MGWRAFDENFVLNGNNSTALCRTDPQKNMKAMLGEWQEVFALLDTALELPPGERAAWLQGLSGSSAEFKTQLERLLAQNARLETGDFLAAPLAIDATHLIFCQQIGIRCSAGVP
jgi:hypothetical protein